MCQKAPCDLQGYKGFLLSRWFPRGQVLNKKELSRNTARTKWNNRISGAFIEVGVELIHFWNMPNQIEQAIPYQLSPSQAGEFTLHASIVHLAGAVGRRLSPSQFRSVLPVTGRISVRDLLVPALLACANRVPHRRRLPIDAGACADAHVGSAHSLRVHRRPGKCTTSTAPSSCTPPKPRYRRRLMNQPVLPAFSFDPSLYICRRDGHANMTGTLIVE
jgi:hypothetical protein